MSTGRVYIVSFVAMTANAHGVISRVLNLANGVPTHMVHHAHMKRLAVFIVSIVELVGITRLRTTLRDLILNFIELVEPLRIAVVDIALTAGSLMRSRCTHRRDLALMRTC